MNFTEPTAETDNALSAGERSDAARKSTLVSVFVNLFMSICQIAVGVFAHSQALIADGVHSLSDLVSDGIVLFANHHSQK